MQDAKLLHGHLLRTERQPNGTRRLLREMTVEVNSRTIVVPKDMVTDYSSIPWYGRWIVNWSKVDIAGVIHDRLYESGELSRAEADEIWYLIATSGEHRAGPVQAGICWIALRIGGWRAWDRCRELQSIAEDVMRTGESAKARDDEGDNHEQSSA